MEMGLRDKDMPGWSWILPVQPRLKRNCPAIAIFHLLSIIPSKQTSKETLYKRNGNFNLHNTARPDVHPSARRLQADFLIPRMGLDPKPQWPPPDRNGDVRQDCARVLAEELHPALDTRGWAFAVGALCGVEADGEEHRRAESGDGQL